MATYSIQAPDGHTYTIEGPEGATQEQVQAEVLRQFPEAAGGGEEGLTGVHVTDGSTSFDRAFADMEDPEAGLDAGRVSYDPKGFDSGYFDENGNPLPNDYQGGVYDANGTYQGLAGSVTFEAEGPKVEGNDAFGAAVYGAADTITLGTLPKLGALITATQAALGGGEFDDAYAAALDENNAIIEADERDHPTARLIGQLIGGLVIPAGLEGVGLKAGTQALRSGATMEVARMAAAKAVGKRMALVGGIYGAGHGAGSADTIPDAITGAATEGAIGAVTGGALGKLGEKLAPRAAAKAVATRAAPVADAERFVQAADRQNIPFMAADVPEATKSKFASAVSSVTLGGIPLAERATQVIERARAARDALADRVGVVRDKTGAGQRAQEGAREWMRTTEGRGQTLEEALPIPPEAKVELGETRSVLKYLTTGLESNPELSRIWTENPRLKQTLDALTPKEIVTPAVPAQKGGMGFLANVDGIPARPAVKTGKFEGGELDWQDMRRLRTIVGQIVGQPGLTSDGAAIDGLRNLYSALSRDMEATAAAVSPRALTAFRRVNQFWRGRESRIDNVLSGILGRDGNKGAQPAFEAIERLAQQKGGDATKLAQTLRSMPPDEAATVRATILHNLGTVSKGRQDVTGEVFSPADFATHWNSLSNRAKHLLFQGQHARDLNDIALVMDGMKSASKFANTSKTGIATTALGTISSGFASPLLPFITGALQFGGGRLLASERMARWVASAAKKPNPKASFAHIERLNSIARAEPAIANEVFSLQQRLAEAFTTVPSRPLAAEDEQDVGANPE